MTTSQQFDELPIDLQYKICSMIYYTQHNSLLKEIRTVRFSSYYRKMATIVFKKTPKKKFLSLIDIQRIFKEKGHEPHAVLIEKITIDMLAKEDVVINSPVVLLQ
tara:strand:+ start:2198 stop:2512 length:315 start_codon:yes stop_codon:yes gene_type:complete